MIDHGAAMFFHFGTQDYRARAGSRFPEIRSHVLLPYATALHEADAALSALLTDDVLHGIVDLVPDEWLEGFPSPAAHRAAYVDYLSARLQAPRAFVEEAVDAHARLV
jgi:hypothetical protein